MKLNLNFDEYKGTTRLKNWWTVVKGHITAIQNAINTNYDELTKEKSDRGTAISAHAEITATGKVSGHVTLADSVGKGMENNDTDAGVAATPKAVRTVKTQLDAHAEASASGTVSGHVKLATSIGSGMENYDTDAGYAATPKAVRTVKTQLDTEISDRKTAISDHAEVTATEENKGHITLSDAVNSDSDASKGTAATPKAVKTVQDKLDGKADKTQYASVSQAGLIKLHKRGDGTNISGLVVYEDGTAVVNTNANKGTTRDGAGQISIAAASREEIAAKTDQYKPIVPATLDYAVSEAAAVKELTSRIDLITAGSDSGLRDLLRAVSMAPTELSPTSYSGGTDLNIDFMPLGLSYLKNAEDNFDTIKDVDYTYYVHNLFPDDASMVYKGERVVFWTTVHRSTGERRCYIILRYKEEE